MIGADGATTIGAASAAHGLRGRSSSATQPRTAESWRALMTSTPHRPPDDAPPVPLHGRARRSEIEARWQDRWDAEQHVRGAEPGRAAGRPRQRRRPAEAVRARHVPVPVRRRPARRPPAGLHRHRRLRPLQADDRPQRAAHDGLRRLRPARRAVRRRRPASTRRSPPTRTSPPIAASCAASAWATTRAAASAPPTRATTAGRSGSSCRSSTPGTTPTPSRARPIGELVAEFEAGSRPTPDGRRLGAICRRSSARDVIDDHRLAYVSEAPVNWCPGLGTVVANEEVTADGRSDRGNFPVFKRNMRQWMMRITAYADRLIDDLDLLDWTDAIKAMQRNWIGRSEGAAVALRQSPAGADHGVHHPARHAVRGDVHGARARASAGRRADDARAAPTPSPQYRAPGRGEEGHRPPGRAPREDRRVHRRRTPSTRSTASRSRCGSPTTC